MKFSAGFWNLRKRIDGIFPAEAYETEISDDRLEVFASTRPVPVRGATLNNPVLSILFSSPMEDVIRVRITHFKGTMPPKPEFEIAEHEPAADIRETDDDLTFSSGDLTARIRKGNGWDIAFRNSKKTLTGSGGKNMGYMTDTATGQTYVKEELALGVGENIYGLGERFTPFVKNGQAVNIWNEDGGTASEMAYKNIPFYLSSRGYGVFVNHPERVSLEVGSEKVERVGFSVPGEYLEYFVINGPSPLEVLERYTALTGRPALPPPWSFGLWLTTSFTTDYDEETVTGFVQGMAQRDLPLHVFHFDCFWMKGLHWVDFEWDPSVFPEPAAMLQRLKAKGLKICVWINPYIAQRSSLFQEGMEKGYLLKRPDGNVYQCNQWQAGMALVDFTNPEAYRWYQDKLAALVDMGVDCFKTDFGERIPTDVAYFDGADPIRMHNYYTHLYNKAVFEILERMLGRGEAVLFARSATAGGQQFPVHWGGDCSATFESMAESLRGGLSLCLSGFGFWSHDIGGFESTASPDVYKRWVAFGLLSSHSRLHGNTSYRVPWLYDEEAVDVLRYFTKLKCRLMPYLFGKAVDAHQRGLPVMRAMILEFPDDPGCAPLDRQYMLGDALLVAPVMDQGGTVEYYLPPGTWTDFMTGEEKEGGRWYRGTYDYMHLPLYARSNTVIALGAEDSRPNYELANDVTFHVFRVEDGACIRGEVPDGAGRPATVLEITRHGSELRINPEQAASPWKALLRNRPRAANVDGGEQHPEPNGLLITPDHPDATVRLTFNP